MRFAVSQLAFLEVHGPPKVYAQALEQALADFPNDPRFQLKDINRLHPDGDVPADKIAALIQAETRSFDLSALGGHRSSVEVRGLYEYLAELIEDEQ